MGKIDMSDKCDMKYDHLCAKSYRDGDTESKSELEKYVHEYCSKCIMMSEVCMVYEYYYDMITRDLYTSYINNYPKSYPDEIVRTPHNFEEMTVNELWVLVSSFKDIDCWVNCYVAGMAVMDITIKYQNKVAASKYINSIVNRFLRDMDIIIK